MAGVFVFFAGGVRASINPQCENTQHSSLLLGSLIIVGHYRHSSLKPKAFKVNGEGRNVCERRGFFVVQYPTVLSPAERDCDVGRVRAARRGSGFERWLTFSLCAGERAGVRGKAPKGRQRTDCLWELILLRRVVQGFEHDVGCEQCGQEERLGFRVARIDQHHRHARSAKLL